jgi:DNA-binding NarL/FixJ family response regulator
VVACADAESGFEMVRRERPEVLITDIGLGVSNGLDLITRIRSDLSPPHPAIIVCSGFDDFEHEAIARGASSFLPKPFEPDTLREMVLAGLGGQPLPPEVAAGAAQYASTLRHEAIDAAEAALLRWGSAREELQRRCELTVRWLPSYLGFGHAKLALIENGHLSPAGFDAANATSRIGSSCSPSRPQE